MYILELITKYIKGKKYKKRSPDYTPDKAEDIIENPDECNHLFMPLDSDAEMFACRNCGLVIPKNKLKK